MKQTARSIAVATKLVTALRRSQPRPVIQQARVITEQQWVEMSRDLIKRAAPFFESDELAVINGFINFAAGDVERLQVERLRSDDARNRA